MRLELDGAVEDRISSRLDLLGHVKGSSVLGFGRETARCEGVVYFSSLGELNELELGRAVSHAEHHAAIKVGGLGFRSGSWGFLSITLRLR